MWDLRIANPFGSLSKRKFLMFVAAVAVTVFAYIFAAAPTTHAADAVWKDNAIVYDGKSYHPLPDAKDGDGLDLPAGTKVYANIDDDKTVPRKAHVIYFAPGSDPVKAKDAHFATYDFADPDKFSGKSGDKEVALTPQAEGDKSAETTSCVYEGIGWIVCPVTNFIANAVDKLYSVLADFLAVRPLQVTEDNSLYRSWAVMRGFANVAFVIGFMIIIYSQLTNVGLSNYNVKRMLPRLIIAAILVNVSYWICAAAIDISNILGYSVQNIFMALRNQVANVDHNSWDVVDFKGITTLVLSGGTLGVAAWLSIAAAGGVLGALYFLGPVLVGVLIAALVAVVIMAVRQAIITILVILAPLAFVAYLLPNTEKYFDKWKDLFTTMLMMFPIFSVLFGGSQFAGTAIIQNSSSIIMIILGMAVQVAPLVILPFLIKFSGGLLGRIGGVVNNKSKGLIDKSKGLAQQKSDLRKSQVMARNNLRRRNVMARTIQGLENGRLNREDEMKTNQTEAEINRLGSSKYQQLHSAQERADMRKHIAEGKLEQHFEHEKLTNQELQELEVQARASKLNVDLTKARVDANWEELKAGSNRSIVTPEGLAESALQSYITQRRAEMGISNLQEQVYATSAEARRTKAAQATQVQNYAKALDTNAELRTAAAGIDSGGEVKVQAAALSELIDDKKVTLAASEKLLENRAILSGSTLKDFSGKVVSEVMSGSTAYTPIEIEAALEAQAKDGQIVNLERARMDSHVDQKILSDVISRNISTLKQKGGFHLQNDMTLAHASSDKMSAARASTLGDTAASNIKDLKAGWVKDVSSQINDIIRHGDSVALDKAYNNIYEALNNPQIRATIGDRRLELEKIEQALYNAGKRPSPELQRPTPPPNTP